MGLHIFDKPSISKAEILVGNLLGTGQHGIGGLDGFHLPITSGVFGPDNAHIGGVLSNFDFGSAHLFKPLKRDINFFHLTERFIECDGIFHGQLGTRTNRIMSSVESITNENDILMTPVFTSDSRECPPN